MTHATDPNTTPAHLPAPPESSATGECGQESAVEIGGRGGLDPVRYGDWEKNGRCIDF